MARNSISNVVFEASKVGISHTVRLYGINTYELDSNFISWGGDNNYNLIDVAHNFGMRKVNSSVEVVGGRHEAGFACGDGVISAFDFGLLYSVFTSMIMAKVELGTTFPIASENLQRPGLWAVWFGNDAVIYSAQNNLILPLKNADTERVCGGGRVVLNNFCGHDTYTLDREGESLCLITEAGELFTYVKITECSKKTYASNFRTPLVSFNKDGGLVAGSMLSTLISETDNRSECLDVLEKYKMAPIIDSIVAREDLIINPTVKYTDTSNFFGSICYTDKEEIAVAVNFRRGLFVYYPWFPASASADRDIKVDPSARFPSFYNVTEGCNRILRYASTVVNRPLTAAQFDINMFNLIKDAFLNMELSRIPIQSTFGRVVIPENILLQELTGGRGESLFCILPVGVVGSNLICLSAEDVLTSVKPSGWELTSAFYDITEVVRRC